MEFEERNKKPQEENNGLPITVLVVLFSIICLLLYAGWHLMSDDASKVSELDENTVIVGSGVDSLPKITQHVELDSTTNTIDASPIEKPLPKEEAAEKEITKKEISTESSSEILIHVVKSGETYLGIGNKFNVSASTMKKLNPTLDPNGLKVGVTKINLPIQGYHTVGPGDILKVVAEKYGISVDVLMSANDKTKNFAKRGERLIIPKKEK
jgi:LysM repeat protein